MQINQKLVWEYRAIDDNLDKIIDMMRKSGKSETRTEIVKYLISRHTQDELYFDGRRINMKIPLRRDRRTGFRQWSPVQFIEFPAHISEIIFLMRSLTDSFIWLSRNLYNWSLLLYEVILPNTGIIVLEVEREIHIITNSELEIEYAYISFSGYHNSTIAIRHHDPNIVKSVVNKLGLQEFESTDYVTVMQKYFIKDNQKENL